MYMRAGVIYIEQVYGSHKNTGLGRRGYEIMNAGKKIVCENKCASS